MKVSRAWLNTFFDTELPSAEKLSEALTFHAFEIDGVDEKDKDSILDVKVTANRGHDCLSHRGIAKELSAILKLPFTKDPMAKQPTLLPQTDAVSVTLEDPALSPRYIAGYIKGVKVGPSPEWLQKHLETLGQRSINNVVDATNFVMFNLGQPLHAFDADKLTQKENKFHIVVRKARVGEKMHALDGKEYTFTDSMLVIADGNVDAPIGVAGVKGGTAAGVSEETKDIIIESANFNSISVRKTAAALKLRTDASARFEQGLSPELAAYGMQSVAELIQQLAGGELVGFADVYPAPQAADVRRRFC
jgi:phenylalanyl-tRNA synthetase beta chain